MVTMYDIKQHSDTQGTTTGTGGIVTHTVHRWFGDAEDIVTW